MKIIAVKGKENWKKKKRRKKRTLSIIKSTIIICERKRKREKEEEETSSKNRIVISMNIFQDFFFYFFESCEFFFLVEHILLTIVFWRVMYFWKRNCFFSNRWEAWRGKLFEFKVTFLIFSSIHFKGFFFIFWKGKIAGSNNWLIRKSIADKCFSVVCFSCFWMHFNLLCHFRVLVLGDNNFVVDFWKSSC